MKKIKTSCCCGPKTGKYNEIQMTGMIDTKAGKIPVVDPKLTFNDILGSFRMRWGIGRHRYSIRPGVYALGRPTSSSPVFVTANYKMSFDRLKKEIVNINCFIIVLDTKGINVWCAAGKGTFGTEELIRRIKAVELDKIVSHRKIILPQLGAPGVAAHIVAKKTGFKPVYGPVRAKDIPAFMKKGMKADERMRRVEFPFKERIILAPMEMLGSYKILLGAFALIVLTHLLKTGKVPLRIFFDFLPYIGAVLTGAVLLPALLPWIPGRSFILKGWLAGLFYTGALGLLFVLGIRTYVAWLFILPAIAAFIALNFTGCSTFTSLSGVKKEMRYGIPAIILSAVLGIITMFI